MGDRREVVKKPPDQQGFAVIPRRWVVQRTFSWPMRFRRLARDFERLPATTKKRLPATHEAIVKWAIVAIHAQPPRPTARPEAVVIEKGPE